MSDTKKIVGVQFNQDDLNPIREWAEAHGLSVAWVVRKCVEVAFPLVQQNPAIRPGKIDNAA